MALTIILTLLSVAAGGIITFLTTRQYYEKASKDLEREAVELRKYSVMLINLLDDAGVVNVDRDNQAIPYGWLGWTFLFLVAAQQH